MWRGSLLSLRTALEEPPGSCAPEQKQHVWRSVCVCVRVFLNVCVCIGVCVLCLRLSLENRAQFEQRLQNDGLV